MILEALVLPAGGGGADRLGRWSGVVPLQRRDTERTCVIEIIYIRRGAARQCACERVQLSKVLPPVATGGVSHQDRWRTYRRGGVSYWRIVI
jgi:hypothetical protein